MTRRRNLKKEEPIIKNNYLKKVLKKSKKGLQKWELVITNDALKKLLKKSKKGAKRRANYKKQASQQPVKERQEQLINTPIHEQTQAKSNIDMFHKSNIYTIYQCSVCREAWPIKFRPKIANQYQCSRCTNDKQQPKKFSKENEINHAFSMQNFRNYYSNLPILERTFLIYDYY